MKKTVLIVTVIVMTLLLCACGQSPTAPAATPEPSSPVNEPSLIPDPFVIEDNCVLVNMLRSSESYEAPDGSGTTIFSYACTVPIVDITGNQPSSDKLNEFFALLEEEFATGADYGFGGGLGSDAGLELALDAFDHSMQTGSPVPTYTMDRQADVKRADSKVFSITVTDTVYTGGASADTVQRAYSFDTLTGEFLSLDSISPNGRALKELGIEHIKKLTEEINGVDPAAVDALDLDNNWYLEQDALVFYANPYELSPSAGSVLRFELRYEDADGLILPDYLPFEHPADVCAVSVVNGLENGQIAILDRLAAEEDGEEFALICSGSVYDLRISSADYVADTNRYYPSRLLWYCSLVKDAAVQIMAKLPTGGVSGLMLSYHSFDGIEHRCIITADESGATLADLSEVEGLDHGTFPGAWLAADEGLTLEITDCTDEAVSFTVTAEGYPVYTVTGASLVDDRASFTTDDGSIRGLLELFSGRLCLTILESEDGNIFAPYCVYEFER